MTEKDFNKIKKDGILTLLPDYNSDQLESFNYMFGNVVLIQNNVNKIVIDNFINAVNKKLSQLILINSVDFYREILPHISPKVKVKWIFTNPLANLTNGMVMNMLRTILEFYDRGLVSKIGCFDYNMYLVLKNAKYPVEYIIPDIKFHPKKTNRFNDIAIISNDYDPNHSYYNMLSALCMIDYKRVKINANMPATKKFIEDFDIKAEQVSSVNKLEANNEINLYVNFTNSEINKILKSMDSGIICIVGNTDIFDSNKYLKEQLVLKSDDDVNEIAKKINNVRKNKDKIFKEYEKFRKSYTTKAIKTIEKFIK